MNTFYDHTEQGYNEREYFDQFNSSKVENPRKVVITAHNSKSYQIDSMSFDQTPDTYMFQMKDGTMASMTEYFHKRYGIKLRSKQPLLFVNYNSGDKVALPAELCHEASLPPNFTSDTYKMREIQPYKITCAEERKKKILKLVSKFINDETLEKWGVQMQQNMAEIKGTKLQVPMILTPEGRTTTFKDFTDRRVKHAQPLKLRNEEWAFCYSARDAELVNKIIQSFK